MGRNVLILSCSVLVLRKAVTLKVSYLLLGISVLLEMVVDILKSVKSCLRPPFPMMYKHFFPSIVTSDQTRAIVLEAVKDTCLTSLSCSTNRMSVVALKKISWTALPPEMGLNSPPAVSLTESSSPGLRQGIGSRVEVIAGPVPAPPRPPVLPSSPTQDCCSTRDSKTYCLPALQGHLPGMRGRCWASAYSKTLLPVLNVPYSIFATPVRVVSSF